MAKRFGKEEGSFTAPVEARDGDSEFFPFFSFFFPLFFPSLGLGNGRRVSSAVEQSAPVRSVVSSNPARVFDSCFFAEGRAFNPPRELFFLSFGESAMV